MLPSGWASGPRWKFDVESDHGSPARRNYSRALPKRGLDWAKPASRSLFSDAHVSQDDDHKLKGLARSIDSLFAEVQSEEEVEDQSAGPVEPEPALESAPTTEPDLGTEPEPGEPAPEPELEFEAPEEPDVVVAEPTLGLGEPEEPDVGVAEPTLGLGDPEPPEEPEAEEPDTAHALGELEGEAEPSSHEAPGAAESAPEESEEEPRTPEELRLEEATSRYLMGTSDQRPSLVEPLRTAVAEARAANALDGLSRAINALLVQPVPDPDAEAVAGELMDAATQMRMAIRLGSVRDERERLGLVEAYAKLGDPMATAIADALSETNDRLARKTYVGALVALGQSGMRVVEQMLGDSRWFVVRNGVAVLGDVGGEMAIAHLTGNLAHEDRRVRRETVLSLAKIGGEDAAQLVVGMLNDSDADVRTVAARAVSVLKAERAFKPLLNILEEGDDDPVIEQVLRALGQLGDPAAVSLIEKRAMGSFFSKPSAEVRVAALSALGSIGTPHAMAVVEAAEDDKDPNVRGVVQQILAAK